MRRAVGAIGLLLAAACGGGEPPGRAAAGAAAAADAAPRRPSPPDAVARASAPGFTVEPLLDLAPAPDGPGARVFTSGGRWPPPPPERAILRVTELPAVDASAAAAEARRRLLATDLATGVRADAPRAVRIGGWDGHEAHGRGRHEGTDVRLYQVLLRAGDRAVLVQGRSSAERWEWYRAAFEQMARTLRRS